MRAPSSSCPKEVQLFLELYFYESSKAQTAALNLAFKDSGGVSPFGFFAIEQSTSEVLTGEVAINRNALKPVFAPEQHALDGDSDEAAEVASSTTRLFAQPHLFSDLILAHVDLCVCVLCCADFPVTRHPSSGLVPDRNLPTRSRAPRPSKDTMFSAQHPAHTQSRVTPPRARGSTARPERTTRARTRAHLIFPRFSRNQSTWSHTWQSPGTQPPHAPAP